MKRVGLIGWRGMVGSVLMQRMLEEQDFDLIEPVSVAKARPWARTLLRSRTLTALKS